MFIFGFVFCSIAIAKSASLTDQEYVRLPPVFEVDNFDRCLLLEDEALYCYVEYLVEPTDPNNSSITWKQMKELSSNPKNYRHDNLRHGICVPLSCPNISRSLDDPELKKDLAHCMNKKYERLGIHGTIEHAFCQTAEPKKFDIYDSMAAIFLIAYILFVIFASLYEGCARYKTPKEYKEITTSKYGKYISCFSIPRSWDKLKTIDWTEDNLRFRAIQGVRFYNMFIVIVVHSALLMVGGPVSNTKFVEEMYDKTLSIFMASGPYGVSTFFQISAMLLTYNIFKHFNEKSEKKFDMKTASLILLYRYIRLTPAMAVILMLHSTLLHHTGRGPWWDECLGIDRRNCRQNGWVTLLYINNWINPSAMCLVETWYLSVDMQAFVLVLFLLYFTVKSSKRFWVVLITAATLNHIYVAWHLYRNELFYFLRPYPENVYMVRALYKDDGVWINTLSHTPMNLSSTFTGAAVGYLIYKYNKISFDTSMTRRVLWWLGSYGLGFGIVAIPGMWLFSENYYDSYWFSIPYLTLSPTIYCLAITLGTMGVVSGFGWMTKWVLEWPPMYYLGRISYTTYLAHYSLTFYLMASKKNLLSASEFTIFLESLKIISMSMILGLMLSLTVEYPVSAIASIFLKKKMVEEKDTNDVKQKSS